MLKVTLEGSGITLDLDEISSNGKGVQAVAGLLGLGLPPVDVQWFEGAGDGAVYRNTRVLARDVDLPIHISTTDRTELKAKIAALSKVMAGPVVMKLYDGSSYVYATFYRVSGGTYVYGGDSSDTNGETEFSSIITMRAGNPYWLHSSPENVTVSGTTTQSPVFSNSGTAKAPPKWTLTGPCAGVTLTSPTGETFSWNGTVLSGQSVTIDGINGTVTDSGGTNRYAGLSLAPTFWRIPPDTSTGTVLIASRAPTVRRNYETNPSMNGANVWSGGTINSGRLFVGTYNTVIARTATPPTITRTLSGLTPGAALVWRANVSSGGAGPPVSPGGITLVADQTYKTNIPSVQGELVINFVVPASGTITYSMTCGVFYSDGVYRLAATSIDSIYVGTTGTFFDGATAGTSGETFSWTGTANASASLATEAAGTPTLKTEWTPRDWMAV